MKWSHIPAMFFGMFLTMFATNPIRGVPAWYLAAEMAAQAAWFAYLVRYGR